MSYPRGNKTEQLKSIEELARDLRRTGRSVDIELLQRPRKARESWPENVAIFIGVAVASGLLGAVASDIYNVIKQWVKGRFRKAQQNPNLIVPPQRFTIYDPNGKVIATLLTDDIEEDGNEEDPLS